MPEKMPPPLSVPFIKSKWMILCSIVVTVLILDQWSKHWIHTEFSWGESRDVVSSYLALTYVRNTGAAFGLLHRTPSYFREPFFIIIPIVALLILGFVFIKLSPRKTWTAVSLSLIGAGAIGNFIDRVRFGFVVDFIDVHWKDAYHWPAFNVADSAIVVGVGVMLLLTLRKEPTGLDLGLFGHHHASAPSSSSAVASE